jgi:hypothetical protein
MRSSKHHARLPTARPHSILLAVKGDINNVLLSDVQQIIVCSLCLLPALVMAVLGKSQ